MLNNNIANDLQQSIAQELDTALSGFAARFFPENSLDIGYEVKQWLGKVGAVGIVTTPQLEYIGHNQIGPVYNAGISLQVAENPPVHRAELKRNNLTSGTGMDLALSAQSIIADVVGPKFGRLCPGDIAQQLENGLVVTTANMRGTVCYMASEPAAKWTCTYSVHPEAIGEYVERDGIFYGPNGCTFKTTPQAIGWVFELSIPGIHTYIYGVVSELRPNVVNFVSWDQDPPAVLEAQQKTPHFNWVAEDPRIELEWNIQNKETFGTWVDTQVDRYFTEDRQTLMYGVLTPTGKMRYELHYNDQISICGDQDPDVQELDFSLSDGTRIVFSRVQPN